MVPLVVKSVGVGVGAGSLVTIVYIQAEKTRKNIRDVNSMTIKWGLADDQPCLFVA